MCKIALTKEQARLVKAFHPQLPETGLLVMPPKRIRVLVGDLMEVENEDHSPSFWARVYEPTIKKLMDAHNEVIKRRGY